MSRGRRRGERPDFTALQAFAVECPDCLQHVAVATALSGRRARCPACGTVFLVPEPEPEEHRLPDPTDDRRRGRRKTAEPLAWLEPPAEPAPHDVMPRPVEAPPEINLRPVPKPPAVFAMPVETPRPVETRPVETPDDGGARHVETPLVFAAPPPPSTRRPRGTESTRDAQPRDVVASPAVEPQPAADPRPAETADTDGLAFRDPVRTIRSGDAEIELRRLTPEEKRLRRARRSILILVVGASLLVMLVVILGTQGR